MSAGSGLPPTPGVAPGLKELLLGADPGPWMQLLLKIPTQKGLIPFKLYPWMAEICREGVSDREMMLKSREIGSSTFWVAEKLRKVLTNPGANLIICANKEDNAINLLRYARQMVYSMPKEFRPRVGRDNDTIMTFPDLGNHIKALPGTPTAGRSERATYLIATEFAYWWRDMPNADEYWSSVTGALVPGGEIVIESTAYSQSDMFHDMWYDPENGYKKRFYNVWASPDHTPEWFTKRKKEIKDEFLFVRDYPETAEQAFVGSADMYFAQEDLLRGQEGVRAAREVKQVGTRSQHDTLSIWKKPIAGRQYVIGADVAEGKQSLRGNPDWSVAIVLDWRTKEHVATLACRLPDDEFAQQLYSLCREYNDAHLAIERNGPGLAVIRTVQAQGYSNFYHYERVTDEVRGVVVKTSDIGWHTTAKSKPIALNSLNIAIKSGDWTSPDARFWDEAKSFGRDGKAIGNAHDDWVMASAIANAVRDSYVPSRTSTSDLTPPKTARPAWAEMFG